MKLELQDQRYKINTALVLDFKMGLRVENMLIFPVSHLQIGRGKKNIFACKFVRGEAKLDYPSSRFHPPRGVRWGRTLLHPLVKLCISNLDFYWIQKMACNCITMDSYLRRAKLQIVVVHVIKGREKHSILSTSSIPKIIDEKLIFPGK